MLPRKSHAANGVTITAVTERSDVATATIMTTVTIMTTTTITTTVTITITIMSMSMGIMRLITIAAVARNSGAAESWRRDPR